MRNVQGKRSKIALSTERWNEGSLQRKSFGL